MTGKRLNRRNMMIATGAALLTPAILRAEVADDTPQRGLTRRNASGFTAQHWADHFDTLGMGCIVADTVSRALHFWSADGSDYRIYPTSVPMSDDLTKRGYTSIVRKKEGPDWTPTASMIARGMDVKYMPPGPGNPLGTHAMYLSWPAYLIHGTHDTRKIGRRSSDGCIGLFNEQIADLFGRAAVGTQVQII